jgi:hypothetical protein
MRILIAALMSACLLSPLAAAQDEDAHFEGLPAGTLEEALTNLRATLPDLEAALEGEPDQAAMNDIHEMTYTLENAMERLRLEIIALENSLEELHLASERWDAEAVAEHGARYLAGARQLAVASER